MAKQKKEKQPPRRLSRTGKQTRRAAGRLAGLRRKVNKLEPVASKVPDLEDQIRSLKEQIAQLTARTQIGQTPGQQAELGKFQMLEQMKQAGILPKDMKLKDVAALQKIMPGLFEAGPEAQLAQKLAKAAAESGSTIERVQEVFTRYQTDIQAMSRGEGLLDPTDVTVRTAELNAVGLAEEANRLQAQNADQVKVVQRRVYQDVKRASNTAGELNTNLSTEIDTEVKKSPREFDVNTKSNAAKVSEFSNRQKFIDEVAAGEQAAGRGVLKGRTALASPEILASEAQALAAKGEQAAAMKLLGKVPKASFLRGAGKLGLAGAGGAGLLLLLRSMFGGDETQTGATGAGTPLSPAELAMAQFQQKAEIERQLADSLIQSRGASAGLRGEQSQTEALNQMLRALQIKQLQTQMGGRFL